MSKQASQSSTRPVKTMFFGDCSLLTFRKARSKVSKIWKTHHLRFFWCWATKNGRTKCTISSNITKEKEREKWRHNTKYWLTSQEVTRTPQRSMKWITQTHIELVYRRKYLIGKWASNTAEHWKLALEELFLQINFWGKDTTKSICSTSREKERSWSIENSLITTTYFQQLLAQWKNSSGDTIMTPSTFIGAFAIRREWRPLNFSNRPRSIWKEIQKEAMKTR